MPYGYNGKILRVNLSSGKISREEPGEAFYRKYLGGRGLISYYLLKELAPRIDPLGPENKLIFAAGVVTGAPAGATGRNSVGAKSPLTGAYGDAEVGGYWGAELKFAGYDAVIFEGKSAKPVYLWIHDGEAELRDASHLWGKEVLDSHQTILKELGDSLIRTTQIGPAGERMVRFANIMNDVNRAAGRTGMGAVMGSKKLKAVAVRGHNRPQMADKETVGRLAKWLADTVQEMSFLYYDQGTPVVLFGLNRASGLPTKNFTLGVFREAAGKIDGRTYKDTILKARKTCWACPVMCKREVATGAPYNVDPAYGGPEYETLAALGSNCGIADLAAIAKANQRCAATGMDTISTGMGISFAIECFQKGILSAADTDGLELTWGNTEAMLALVEKIAKREGFGNVLAEGSVRAAKQIGRGAEECVVAIKGQEVPMHEPRYKVGLGLGYMVSPTGADHCHNIHDDVYTTELGDMKNYLTTGLLEKPVPLHDIGPEKVKVLIAVVKWRNAQNSLVVCQFPHWDLKQTTELVGAVTGWDISLGELMISGERCINMDRLFNIREGFTRADDRLPKRFFTGLVGGSLGGVSLNPDDMQQALTSYYTLMGWDSETGVPKKETLQRLGLE